MESAQWGLGRATDSGHCGSDAGGLGLSSSLGSSWECYQGEPGKEWAFLTKGLSPRGGLGGGASLRAKSRVSLLTLPLTCCESLGLRFCICKMTGLDELKSNFIVLMCHDWFKSLITCGFGAPRPKRTIGGALGMEESEVSEKLCLSWLWSMGYLGRGMGALKRRDGDWMKPHLSKENP